MAEIRKRARDGGIKPDEALAKTCDCSAAALPDLLRAVGCSPVKGEDGALFRIRNNKSSAARGPKTQAKKAAAKEEAVPKAAAKKAAAAKKKKEAEKLRRQKEEEVRKMLEELRAAGFPEHINEDYLGGNYTQLEIAHLFKFLRSNGAPESPENDADPIPVIDFLVFNRIISKEDGLFLMNSRHHPELFDNWLDDDFNKMKKKIKESDIERHLNFMKQLFELGFSGHNKLVQSVIDGANPKTVAILNDLSDVHSEEDGESEKIIENKDEFSESENNEASEEMGRGRFVR